MSETEDEALLEKTKTMSAHSALMNEALRVLLTNNHTTEIPKSPPELNNVGRFANQNLPSQFPENPYSKLNIAKDIANGWVKNIGVPAVTAPYHHIENLMKHGYTPGAAVGQPDIKAIQNAADVGTDLLMGGIAKSGVVRPNPVGQKDLGMFGGVRSKTANLDELQLAKKLDKEGAPLEEIISQTGWGYGKDGKWRYEIFGGDKSKMEWIQNKGYDKSHYLPDIWHFPELYKSYPELKEVFIKGGEAHGNGAFMKSRSKWEPATIQVNLDDFGKMGTWPGNQILNNKKIITHEGQHAIQDIEGFNPGFNSELINHSDYLKNAHRPAIQGEIDRLMRKYEKNKGQNASPYSDRAAMEFATKEALSKVGRDIYKRNSGEVEAYLAMDRANYTDAQRLSKPWNLQEKVPRKDQLGYDIHDILKRIEADNKSASSKSMHIPEPPKPKLNTESPGEAIGWLQSQRPVDTQWVKDWAKDANIPVEVKPAKTSKTDYVKLKDDLDKNVTVRVPNDSKRHHGEPPGSGKRPGNYFDTGIGPSNHPYDERSMINQGGMSYANPEALDNALRWRFSKAPHNQNWLVSDDMAPRLKQTGREELAPKEQFFEHPDQMKLLSNKTDQTTAAIIALLKKTSANDKKPIESLSKFLEQDDKFLDAYSKLLKSKPNG